MALFVRGLGRGFSRKSRLPNVPPAVIVPDQTVGAVSDQVSAACAAERLEHERPVGGNEVLHERALHGLLVGIPGHVNRLHVARVEAGVKHGGGQRAGGGVEVLHLLGTVSAPLDEQRQLDRVLECAAGMRGHVVGHEELLEPRLFVLRVVAAHELLVDRHLGLAHVAQHAGGHVLRRDLELTGDVMPDQLGQELLRLVGQHVVEPHAAAHEYLLHAGQRAHLAQEFDIVLVIRVQVFAGLREQALLALARAARQLTLAGRAAEVGGRAAHIVYVALEAGPPGQQFGLGEHRFVTARGHNAPLMKGQRAERARAEAAAVVRDRELDLLKRRNAARRVVHRMPGAHVGQGIGFVQLLLRQRHAGLVRDQVAPAVLLADAPAANRILLVVLRLEGAGVGLLVPRDLLHRFDEQVVLQRLFAQDAGARNARLTERQAGLQPFGRRLNRVLTHAVDQQIRAAVHQDRVAHPVVPVVVVREPAQRGLHAADEYRHAAIGLPDAVAVDDRGAVGPPAAHAAGRIHVLRAALFGHGVVIDHAVDHARHHQKAQPRPAEALELLAGVVLRLGQHGYPVPGVLQHPRDDGQAERGMIHVRVAGDEHKIRLLPA